MRTVLLGVLFLGASLTASGQIFGSSGAAKYVQPQGATLPSTCKNGQLYQKISGGSEGLYSCTLGSWVAAGAGSVGTAGTGISIVGSTIGIDSTTTPQKNATGTWTAKQTFELVGITPSTAPGTPTSGQLYVDSTANVLSWYNGTAWKYALANVGTTLGDMLYCSDTATPCAPARLAAGTSGYFLRANGAGAAPSWAIPTASQISNAFDITTYNNLTRISAPANPASGYLRVFANESTGKLACLDSAGADCMPAGSGGGSPGGSGTEIQYRGGASTFSALANSSVPNAGELLLGTAPTASATRSALGLGGAISGGNASTNGGTWFSINAPGSGAGTAADFIRFANNGTTMAYMNQWGAMFADSYAFNTSGRGSIVAMATGVGIKSSGGVVQQYIDTSIMGLTSSMVQAWSSSADATSGFDVGLARNAAGVLEVNSGTAGTLRDLKLRDILIAGTAPSTSSDACTANTVRVDANYIYVCTATNTWKRAALSTF